MKNSIKFSQNTIISLVVVAFLFLIVGFTATSLFQALNISREVDPDLLKSSDERILESDLQNAMKQAFDREYIPLDLPN